MAGYDHAKANFVPLGTEWTFSGTRRPFLTGNEAISLGAVTAGCKFYSAYPMTPASAILHWMVSHAEKSGVVVKQCEDELAVVNMAIGAGYAGVRAMCGTSGGGFALMTEAIGMAGMIEAPVVIVEVQRGGPSTGVPTKTEQADLNQVFGASQGDYPRAIIAPTDTTDCFYTAVEALNLAEKYQLPVTSISDVFTTSPVRRKDQEKRMRKLDGLPRDTEPPVVERPQDANVTLIGWGSTKGVIHEAIVQLASEGIRANQLPIKYLVPFHSNE